MTVDASDLPPGRCPSEGWRVSVRPSVELQKGYPDEAEVQSGTDCGVSSGGRREARLGKTVEEICGEIGVSDATYCNWRKTYGHLKVDQAKRLKDLQKENARLKKLVADLSLDKAILKEAIEGKY